LSKLFIIWGEKEICASKTHLEAQENKMPYSIKIYTYWYKKISNKNHLFFDILHIIQLLKTGEEVS